MHILIIPTMYPHDYNPVSNIFFRDQAEALAANGHKVGVLAIIPITIQAIIKRKKWNFGITISNINNVTTYIFTFPALPKTERFKQFIRAKVGIYIFKKYLFQNGKPDIMHVHTFVAGITAIAIEDAFGIPFVVTEHSSSVKSGFLTRYQNYLANVVYNRSKINISVSDDFSRWLSNRYSLPFITIPNVVDTVFFTTNSNKNLYSSDIKILNIASLDKNKQHSLLLHAFKNVISHFSNMTLAIGGDGPERPALKRLVKKLDIDRHVLFLGKLTRDEVKDEMQNCDIFLLTSKIETFGVVLIEAMACGKPVISTKSGGPESIVIRSEYGELVNQTVESITDGIMRVVSKLNKYDSNMIRKYIEDNYSGKIIAQKLVSVYKNICIA
jgi:glycosyltransferase involved in cell wall biosynthesis